VGLSAVAGSIPGGKGHGDQTGELPAVSGEVICCGDNLPNDHTVANLPHQMLRTVVGIETIWRQYLKLEDVF